jgi:WS/DGAT/MGAT family acyltransferase
MSGGAQEELRQWGRDREMTAFEALMWRAEADPTLRSQITAVEILDCLPDWDRLVAAHDWGSRLVPRFRERVAEPLLGFGPPEWAADKNFDLAYHLRRVALPAPGGMRQLLDLVKTLAIPPLDPARPLWEATLVEGLDGDRAAYVLKMHHSLTDGMGAIQLLSRLHSRRREPTDDKLQLPPPEPQSPRSTGILAGQVARRVGAAPGDTARLVGNLPGSSIVRGLVRPDRVVGEAVHFARSLQRVLAPPPVPGSPLLAGRSLAWHFEALSVPLADLRAAAKAGGGSVNDAFLAALLGAFRRYHEECGAEIETMPFAIPISLRSAEHPMGGNRFAGARFPAPVGEPDPRERIRLVREFVVTARAEPAIDALNLLAPVMSRLPSHLVTEIGRRSTHANDVQASNVPGIGHPVYIAGARATHMFPFGPLPGCAAMIVLVSHDGNCCLGANVDPAAVTDTELFAQCLQDGFDEVLALAE